MGSSIHTELLFLEAQISKGSSRNLRFHQNDLKGGGVIKHPPIPSRTPYGSLAQIVYHIPLPLYIENCHIFTFPERHSLCGKRFQGENDMQFHIQRFHEYVFYIRANCVDVGDRISMHCMTICLSVMRTMKQHGHQTKIV